MTPEASIHSAAAFDTPRSSTRGNKTSDTDSAGVRFPDSIPSLDLDFHKQCEANVSVFALEGEH